MEFCQQTCFFFFLTWLQLGLIAQMEILGLCNSTNFIFFRCFSPAICLKRHEKCFKTTWLNHEIVIMCRQFLKTCYNNLYKDSEVSTLDTLHLVFMVLITKKMRLIDPETWIGIGRKLMQVEYKLSISLFSLAEGARMGQMMFRQIPWSPVEDRTATATWSQKDWL